MRDAEDDLLPPFSSLTNDEDREKKAEYRAPGTYNIIANPSSFTGLEEYRTFLDDAKPLKEEPQGQRSMDGVQSWSSGGGAFSEDPDVVILSRFQDDVGGLSYINTHYSRFVGSLTPTLSDYSTISTPHAETSSARSEAPTILQVLRRDRVDSRLISHYNNFMRRSFAQVQRDSLGTLFGNDNTSAHEIIGQKATGFPPVSKSFVCTIHYSRLVDI